MKPILSCYQNIQKTHFNQIFLICFLWCGIFSCFLRGKFKKFILYAKTIQDKTKLTSKIDSPDKITPSHPLEPPSYLYWIGRYTDFRPFLDFLFFPDSYFPYAYCIKFSTHLIQFLLIDYLWFTSYFYAIFWSYSILFYSILFYSILFYSILFYFVPLWVREHSMPPNLYWISQTLKKKAHQSRNQTQAQEWHQSR